MSFPNIALVGDAGSGKSTLAGLLVERHDFKRVALAGPLKLEVARMFIGPMASPAECFAYVEANKPQLRALLQAYGVAKRDLLGQDYWVRMTMLAAASWNGASRPVVVDDCRFLNEADHFRRAGWRIIRVHRPQPVGAISDEQRQHVSEREHRLIAVDATLTNTGTLDGLYTQLMGVL